MPIPIILYEAAVMALGILTLDFFTPDKTEEHQDLSPIFPEEEEPIKSNKPTNIYEDNSRTYVINIENNGKPDTIEIPYPRLPDEPDSDTATKTPRGKSINIKKSVFKHEFGGMLYRPKKDKKLTVWDREISDKSHKEKFKEAQENAIPKLAEYYANRDDVGKLLQLPHKIEELGIIIVPENIRGFWGNIKMLYSLESLGIMNQEYTIRSETAISEPVLSAYKEIIRKEKRFNVNIKVTLPDAGEESGISLTPLGDIFDWLGIDDLYRVQDEKILIDTLLKKFGNANLLQAKENAESNNNNELTEYKPQPQKFVNFLEYYTSLIAVAFWKLGLPDLPAKVPKDLSVLPDFEGTIAIKLIPY